MPRLDLKGRNGESLQRNRFAGGRRGRLALGTHLRTTTAGVTTVTFIPTLLGNRFALGPTDIGRRRVDLPLDAETQSRTKQGWGY